MEYFDVIRSRHSVRSFTDEPVDDSILEAILDAASRAPSAGNLQAYEVYVVRRAKQKRMLAIAAVDQMFVAKAPVVLVFAASPERSARKYGRRGTDLYALQDATIACTFAMLAATALGLACVWVGAFDDAQTRLIINAPETLNPIAVLPIGHGDEPPHLTQRRPPNEIVHECATG